MSTIELSFWDHLRELRSRMIKALVGLFLGAAVAFHFWREIWVWAAYPLDHQGLKVDLIATSPVETFLTSIKISLLAGTFMALPWILWHVWRFVAPALYAKERQLFLPSFFASIAMFFGGTAFCYFVVLPAGLYFLATYTDGLITQSWKQGEYATFITKFLLAFGILFQMPVVTFVLAKLELVTARSMWSFFKYAIIVIFILAALLTPGPDPVSQILLALPLCCLYVVSIGVCALVQKRNRQNEENEAEALAGEAA